MICIIFSSCCFKNKVGGKNFEHRTEVVDLLAYLRFAHNPHDRLSFERIINVPRRGISHRTVTNIYSALESIQRLDTGGDLSIIAVTSRLAEGELIHGVRLADKVLPILQKFVQVVLGLLQLKRSMSSVVDMLQFVVEGNPYDAPRHIHPRSVCPTSPPMPILA